MSSLSLSFFFSVLIQQQLGRMTSEGKCNPNPSSSKPAVAARRRLFFSFFFSSCVCTNCGVIVASAVYNFDECIHRGKYIYIRDGGGNKTKLYNFFTHYRRVYKNKKKETGKTLWRWRLWWLLFLIPPCRGVCHWRVSSLHGWMKPWRTCLSLEAYCDDGGKPIATEARSTSPPLIDFFFLLSYTKIRKVFSFR